MKNIKGLVKQITDKVMNVFKIEKVKGEYYVKVDSPEEFRKTVQKTVRMELANLLRENMDLKKQIKELSKTIDVLKQEREQLLMQEVQKQKSIIANIIKSAQYNLFFDLKKPVKILTQDGNFFVDENGVEKPYLQGIRLVQLPDNVKIELILSHKKKTKNVRDLSFLSPYPPLTMRNLFYLPQNLQALIKQLRMGLLVTNVTDEGYLLTGSLPVYLIPPRERDKPKSVKKGDK